MGKRKYHTTVWVIEDEAHLRREILEVLQQAFKRHVLIRAVQSLQWALNMDGQPDLVIVDASADPTPITLRHTSTLIRAFLQKYHEVRIGMVGFWATEVLKDLDLVFPEAKGRAESILGTRVSVGMVEFIQKHIDKGTACTT